MPHPGFVIISGDLYSGYSWYLSERHLILQIIKNHHFDLPWSLFLIASMTSDWSPMIFFRSWISSSFESEFLLWVSADFPPWMTCSFHLLNWTRCMPCLLHISAWDVLSVSDSRTTCIFSSAEYFDFIESPRQAGRDSGIPLLTPSYIHLTVYSLSYNYPSDKGSTSTMITQRQEKTELVNPSWI